VLKNRSLIIAALCLGALLIVAVAGCGSSTPPAQAPAGGGGTGSAPALVVEENFAFTPSQVTVKVGDTVTFENKDSAPHRVNIDGQDLGQQTTGQKVEWKATKAGTFPFVCSIHPAMTGQVTVQ
jgi:plastocyanin